jgi:3-oxoadipate enol-lactonase
VFADTNGARIHFERRGAGEPLILLHAGVADSRMWEPQVAAFAQHFDVITPDIRGYGESDLPAAEWNPRADVLELMDRLQLQRAHLVGCSIGGGFVLDFALDHPDRASKIVLVGPGVGGVEEDPNHKDLYAEAEAAYETKDVGVMNEADMRLWLDGPYRPKGYVKEPLRSLFLEMNRKNLEVDWSAAPTTKLEPPAAQRLQDVTAPTLVIVGDKDVAPIVEVCDLLVSSIPGAHKAVIQDAAHLPNLEHPEEFNRLVLDFLLG